MKLATAGGIAAQRENIFTAQRAEFLQQCADFGLRVVDAGEMRERGQLVLALDAVHNHQRFFPRAAAGTVSDRAEIRTRREQGGDLFFEQVMIAFVRLGRKEFKGDDWFPSSLFLGKNVANETHEYQKYEFKLDATPKDYRIGVKDANKKSTYLDMMICYIAFGSWKIKNPFRFGRKGHEVLT